MIIIEKREPGKLTLEIKGRLETTTALQLEETLEGKLMSVKELVMDLSALEYVSSAGLRVLLSAHKTMAGQKGSMVVRGANEEVREVFDITGFSQMLTIE